jgi:D-glycero-alpha-D-manno-heptose-7-phosphate kinase
MIISKTPLRIPFAGGLTDLRPYAQVHGGITVSTTIDKYIYVGVKTNVDGYFNLKYLDAHEKVRDVNAIRHNHVRETLKLLDLGSEPVDVYIMTDLNYESGLGSSGAVTVGLLNALHGFRGDTVERTRLIEEASVIEMDVLDGAGGYHDHTITALGGLRGIRYAEGMTEDEVFGDRSLLSELEDRLVFLYSGHHAKTKPSLDVLTSKLRKAAPVLKDIAANAEGLWGELARGDLSSFGERIQAQQDLKQRLPGHFSSDMVVETMAKVKRIGAYGQIPGGKIGAFLMMFVPNPDQRASVKGAFPDMREIRFSLSTSGSIVTEV